MVCYAALAPRSLLAQSAPATWPCPARSRPPAAPTLTNANVKTNPAATPPALPSPLPTPTPPVAAAAACREPQFANAERSCLWELSCLASHVHPSVAAMARTLLAGANVVYAGDPLRDLTLGAFLDKFVQKKGNVGVESIGAYEGEKKDLQSSAALPAPCLLRPLRPAQQQQQVQARPHPPPLPCADRPWFCHSL